MHVTGLWSLFGAAVFGLILADIWIHPAGTKAAGNAIIGLEKNTGNQLLGKAA